MDRRRRRRRLSADRAGDRRRVAGDVIRVRGGVYREDLVLDKRAGACRAKGSRRCSAPASGRWSRSPRRVRAERLHDRRQRHGRDQRDGRGRAGAVERQPDRRQPHAARVLRHRRRRCDAQRNRRQRDPRACASSPFGRRGDGIYLYRAPENFVARNRVSGERDGIYFQYAPRGRAVDNVVTDSRYGLHDMFSDDVGDRQEHVQRLGGRRQHHELAPDPDRRQHDRSQSRRARASV